jgi:uncharacterized protein (DUF1330 family)
MSRGPKEINAELIGSLPDEGPVVMVRYPSRAAFLDMVASPEYAVANAHRERGLEKHVIVAAGETYSKLKP